MSPSGKVEISLDNPQIGVWKKDSQAFTVSSATSATRMGWQRHTVRGVHGRDEEGRVPGRVL
jgi:hypothetical protein